MRSCFRPALGVFSHPFQDHIEASGRGNVLDNVFCYGGRKFADTRAAKLLDHPTAGKVFFLFVGYYRVAWAIRMAVLSRNRVHGGCNAKFRRGLKWGGLRLEHLKIALASVHRFARTRTPRRKNKFGHHAEVGHLSGQHVEMETNVANEVNLFKLCF
jgi:hypothetical protein